LCETGGELVDGRVVKKILRVVPKKYKQVAVAIEMLTDLDKTTIEELIGRLHVVEDAYADEEKAEKEVREGMERLLLTREQSEASRRQKHGKEWTCYSTARHVYRKKEDGRDGGHDEEDDDASMISRSSRRSERCNRGRCFNCNERGHIAKFCLRQREGKALMADASEEAILM
jgi:hypothetical protein